VKALLSFCFGFAFVSVPGFATIFFEGFVQQIVGFGAHLGKISEAFISNKANFALKNLKNLDP